MDKVKLDLDELVVESFETEGTEEEKGTVYGQGSALIGTCFGTACVSNTYDDDTCVGPSCRNCPSDTGYCNCTVDAC